MGRWLPTHHLTNVCHNLGAGTAQVPFTQIRTLRLGRLSYLLETTVLVSVRAGTDPKQLKSKAVAVDLVWTTWLFGILLSKGLGVCMRVRDNEKCNSYLSLVLRGRYIHVAQQWKHCNAITMRHECFVP